MRVSLIQLLDTAMLTGSPGQAAELGQGGQREVKAVHQLPRGMRAVLCHSAQQGQSSMDLQLGV